MHDEIFYSLVFVLLGLIGIHWGKNATKSKNDPLLVRVTLIGGGIFCFVIAIYLILKII